MVRGIDGVGRMRIRLLISWEHELVRYENVCDEMRYEFEIAALLALGVKKNIVCIDTFK